MVAEKWEDQTTTAPGQTTDFPPDSSS